MHHRRGFTILELLVVMAIIGILAAIGLSAYPGVQRKARDARRKSDLANIGRALEMYRGDMGLYPLASPASCAATTCAMNVGVWGGVFQQNNQIYMQEVPTDRRGSYDYRSFDVNGRPGYMLFARMENEEDGDPRLARIGTTPARFQIGTDTPLCGTDGCNYYFGSTNAPAPTAVAFP